MKKSPLYNLVQGTGAMRAERIATAQHFEEHTELVPQLLEIAFLKDDKVSCRAWWVLEKLTRGRLDLFLPYLAAVLNKAPQIHLDSAVRPLAKICEIIVLAAVKEKDKTVLKFLSNQQLKQITTLCFDWLIGRQKVAVKAYAMNALYWLGTLNTWVHPQLKRILVEDAVNHSAAYRARAKHILKRLSK